MHPAFPAARRPLLALPALLLSGVPFAAIAHGADQATASADGFTAMPVKVTVTRTGTMYQMQGVSLDHLVGDGIPLLGATIPAVTDAKGRLQLDLDGTGHPTTVKAGHLTVAMATTPGKPKEKLDLWLAKSPGGDWQYRTVTVLGLQIGADHLQVIDVAGDGTFATPGATALAWDGCTYAFAVPAADQRWCTPHYVCTGLTVDAATHHATVRAKPLATALAATLPLLTNLNQLRAGLGLTPRPEDPLLSTGLQQHCHYMNLAGNLSVSENQGQAGYSPEGDDAAKNSLVGHDPDMAGVPMYFLCKFYHRIDLVRPGTTAFGLGSEGIFSAIDGRRDLPSGGPWPVLIPAPDADGVPTAFSPESPDPLGGQGAGGFAITAYFDSAPTLTAWSLKKAGAGQPATDVPCLVFDSTQGGMVAYNRIEKVAALIPKEPLAAKSVYQVSMTVTLDGTTWTRQWSFTTGQ